MCGTNRWKAALKTVQHLDETGVVRVGCHHVINQKAVNMFCGEMCVCAHFNAPHCNLVTLNIHRYAWVHLFSAYGLPKSEESRLSPLGYYM